MRARYEAVWTPAERAAWAAWDGLDRGMEQDRAARQLFARLVPQARVGGGRKLQYRNLEVIVIVPSKP